MSKFAIFVTFQIKPGMGKDFLPHILENASSAVRHEPDCQMFRVMNAEGDPDCFHFFEVYSNCAALEAHRETPHYKKFREATDHMVIDRKIQPLDLLQ